MEFNLKVNEGEIQLIAAGLSALTNGLVAKLQAQVNEQIVAQQPPVPAKRNYTKRKLKLVPPSDQKLAEG